MKHIFLLLTLVTTTLNVHASQVREVSSQHEFNYLISTNSKVVVDIFATWCGPCRRMAPVFARLAQEHPEALFIKVDADKAPQILQALGVDSFPTFKLYTNGQPYTTINGSNEKKLEKAVKGLVSSRSISDIDAD